MIVWPAGVITENRASVSGSAAASSVSPNALGYRTDVIFKSLESVVFTVALRFRAAAAETRLQPCNNACIYSRRELLRDFLSYNSPPVRYESIKLPCKIPNKQIGQIYLVF